MVHHDADGADELHLHRGEVVADVDLELVLGLGRAGRELEGGRVVSDLLAGLCWGAGGRMGYCFLRVV